MTIISNEMKIPVETPNDTRGIYRGVLILCASVSLAIYSPMVGPKTQT